MIMQFFSRSFRSKFLVAAALLIVSPTTTFAQDADTVITDESKRDQRKGVIQLGGTEREVRIENTEELLVRTVAQSNPTTPVELAKAIGLMIDISRFEKASQYLDSLSKLELDGEASYELNRVVGAELFYEMARARELQPAGREMAIKVFTAASDWANSDARIDTLIKRVFTRRSVCETQSRWSQGRCPSHRDICR